MEPIKVTYEKAQIYRRFLAFFVDAFIYIFLSAVLFGVSHTIIPNIPAYGEVLASRRAIQEDSGLFRDGDDIVVYVATLSSDTERKDYLSAQIESFYNTQLYCPASALGEYRSRQAEAKNASNAPLFVLKDGKLVETSLAPADFVTFYGNEVRQHALSYLFQTEAYLKTTQTVFLVTALEIALWATANYFFFYLIMPLCIFRKGRQTIGRAIFRIGILTKKAVSPRRGKFIARACAEYGLFVVLSFFAFFIPLIVSTTMLFLSENSQNLLDFMFGHYMVDTRRDQIYEDPSYYEKRQQLDEHSLLEDNDFKIERPRR